MKRFTIILCFSLLFSTLSPFLSSRAIAFDPKTDLVSAIDIKATGLMIKKALAENGTVKEGSLTPEFSIPVRNGLSTYIDCSSPYRQDLPTKKESDYRAVLGLHIPLK